MEILRVILTSLLSVVTLFIIAKIMGHKQLAQLDFFDYIAGITIGSIASELAIDIETPIKPFIAMIIYGIVSVTLSLITHKFPKMRKFINGTPTIIMDNGKLYYKNMKKAKLDLSEFMVLLREGGYFDLNEIQTAVFEQNGNLSVLLKSEYRSLTANDINLSTKDEYISTELIMDGRILDENLKRMGLDIKWLNEKIKELGFNDTKKVFLALCDNNKTVTAFGYN